MQRAEAAPKQQETPYYELPHKPPTPRTQRTQTTRSTTPPSTTEHTQPPKQPTTRQPKPPTKPTPPPTQHKTSLQAAKAGRTAQQEIAHTESTRRTRTSTPRGRSAWTASSG